MENNDKHRRKDKLSDIESTFVEGSEHVVRPSPETPPRSTTAEHPSGGEKIGNGTVVKMIGQGGMARIYLTWCEKLELHRVVKILQPEINNNCLQRFETEARITAKLHHPNIVEIHSVDEWNGLAFIEMEYLDGDDLKKRIKRNGRLPFEVCTAIGVLICRALEYAHGQEFKLYSKQYRGIIHRDLKPENVMVTRAGLVKLMDFGIARPTETSLHTVEGNITGTLPYLSPEQMEGCDIDVRTDIDSFCGSLFEMLTGERVFPQDDITSLVNAKARGQFREISQYNLGIPKSLRTIVRRCLQTQPSRRYKDAGELLAALEKAHAELSSVSPEKVVSAYVVDPNGTAGSATKAFKVTGIVPKAIVAVAVLILTGGVVLWMKIKDPQNETANSSIGVPVKAIQETKTEAQVEKSVPKPEKKTVPVPSSSPPQVAEQTPPGKRHRQNRLDEPQNQRKRYRRQFRRWKMRLHREIS